MNLCPKGCGRPAQVRGMCRNHYNAARKYELNRKAWSRRSGIGAARRIRALVALGYTQTMLAQQSGIDVSYICKLAAAKRAQVNTKTAQQIWALYDKLSMTPGPSQAAKDQAHRKGWMPPLAWDDDTIDDPDARPDPGHQEKLGFSARYLELRELGYSDLDILRKWQMKPESLLRQIQRYDLTPTPELITLAASIKHARRRTA